MKWASSSKWRLSAFPKRPRLDVSLHFCLSSQAGCLLCRPPRQQWQEKHESFLLHVTLPNSFASPYPPGIWFASELPLHSLDDCFLCIYWETGPLGGAEDAVNRTCKRPHLMQLSLLSFVHHHPQWWWESLKMLVLLFRLANAPVQGSPMGFMNSPIFMDWPRSPFWVNGG